MLTGGDAQNIGLQARILSTRTFTIFVVMALLTTFATTPLVTVLYPPWYQKKLAAWKRGEIEWDSDPSQGLSTEAGASKEFVAQTRVGQLLVYLRLDNMPGLLNLVSLFGKETTSGQSPTDKEQEATVAEKPLSTKGPQTRAVRAHGIRLIQLGDRDSSVMTVSEVEEYTKTDPIVNTWRIVGQIMKVGISGEVATMPESRFAEALLTKSSDISSDFLLLPWSGSGTLSDGPQQHPENKVTSSYIQFTKEILASTAQNVGIFVPQHSVVHQVGGKTGTLKLQRAYSFSDIHREIEPLPVKNKAHRIILPFFGGDDDRFALMLLLQLCEKHEVTGVVTHMHDDNLSSDDRNYLSKVSSHLPGSFAGRIDFQPRDISDTTDDVTSAVSSALQHDTSDVTWTNLVILGRRSGAGKLATGKIRTTASEEVVDCLGDSAGLFISAEVKADILIVQARA